MKTKTKTKPSERRMWSRYKAGDKQARGELIDQYLPRVRSLAKRTKVGKPCVDVEELESFGILGLIDAMSRFDYRKNASFKTFCYFRLLGAMMDGLREMDWMPRLAREKQKAWDSAHQRLSSELGRSALYHEVLSEIKNAGKFAMFRDSDGATVTKFSLDSGHAECVVAGSFVIKGDDFASELADKKAQDPADALAIKDGFNHLLSLLDTRKERWVFEQYYQDDISQKVIGESMGCCEARVCQILKKGRAKIRRKIEDI